MRKAIIIGGGPAGLSVALRLQQITDISPTIYEIRPEPSALGGAVGIFPNGLRLFHRLGVYDDLITRGSSESILTLRSLKDGIIAKQDIVGTVREKNGGFGYLRIKRTELVDGLLKAAQKAEIPIHYGKKLTKIEEDEKGVNLTFSDGTTDTADILLGCDGIHSVVRRLYVDPTHATEYTGFSGLGAIIPTSSLPPSSSQELKGINATFIQEGVFATMACSAEGKEIVWGVAKEVALPQAGDSRDGWEVKREEELADFKNHLFDLLANAKGEWGSLMRTIVNETSVVRFYPVFQLASGGTWYKGRCLLLGDAGHAMPPHAGQGVSMALEDVFLISRLLEDPTRSLEDAFATYDRVRRPRVNEITKKSISNSEVRKKSGSWGLWLKELAIWAYFWGAEHIGYKTGQATEKLLLYDIDEAAVSGGRG